MPISAAEWEQIESAEGLITGVHTVLQAGAPRAYGVDDFFRDVGPESPEEFELLDALIDAIDWRVSRHRSEALVEIALEVLVFEGYAEKKMHQRDGEYVAYYRSVIDQSNHTREGASEAVQATPEVEASPDGEIEPEPGAPIDQQSAQSPH